MTKKHYDKILCISKEAILEICESLKNLNTHSMQTDGEDLTAKVSYPHSNDFTIWGGAENYLIKSEAFYKLDVLGEPQLRTFNIEFNNTILLFDNEANLLSVSYDLGEENDDTI